MMRRRDNEAAARNGEGAQQINLDSFEDSSQDNQEEGSLFIEGMFGGLLTIPLPVPEILSSLDKTTFKRKQAQQKKKNPGLNESQYGFMRQCPICWSDFCRNDFVTTLHCDEKHIFHTECIEQWIRRGQNSCPLCRQQIANL